MATAAQRKALLASVCDRTTFVSSIEATVNNGKENGSITEFYEALTRKQRDQFWADVYPTLADAATALHDEQASGGEDGVDTVPVDGDKTTSTGSDQQQRSLACRVINAAVDVLTAALQGSKQSTSAAAVSEHMLAAAVVVHDQLFVLGDNEAKLKEKISLVCESWWKNSLGGKEQLVPQTISYLLMKALHEDAKASDVKRVHNFREALLLLDLSDSASALLQSALLQCTVNPIFLSVTEGKRFCSYLFCLHLDLIDALHSTIRATLAVCPKNYLDDYGDIYFRAWRSATGPYLAKIERTCIQDLMDRAVVAQREPFGGVALALRRVLDCFHDKKRERGMDEALERLYQPILWRGLTAGNPLVRANAAALLVGAFPLQNPNLARAEADDLMQKQFDAIADLLTDDYPIVRLAAVEGVCRIMGMYWELIPKTIVVAYLGQLVGTLACDASSTAVRSAVFKGLAYLLDNHLCRPVLRDLLPRVAEMVHDPCASVRRALLDLLLTVKTIRTIKFWDVVPVSHLLARLEIEAPDNARRIVELLHTSYFPEDKPDPERIARCLQMTRTQPGAARVFFQHLAHFVSESELVPCNSLGKFVVTVLDTIVDEASGDALLEDFGEDTVTPINNEADTTALLEACAILLASLAPLLKASENKTFARRLFESASPITAHVKHTYGLDSNAMAAAQQIQCYVVASTPQVKAMLTELQNTCDTASATSVLACLPVVDCLCAWGRQDDVLKLVHAWLQQSFTDDDGSGTTKMGAKKGAKATKPKGKSAPQSGALQRTSLALECMDRVVHNLALQQQTPALRASKSKRKGNVAPATAKLLTAVSDTLGRSMNIVDDRLANLRTTAAVDGSHLLRALQMTCRTALLLTMTTAKQPAAAASTATEHCDALVQWARGSLVPAATTDDAAGKKRTSNRAASSKKRKGTDAVASTSTIESVHPYLSLVCSTAVEAFKLGLVRADHTSDAGLYSNIQGLCRDVVALDMGASHHAKDVGRLLCEVVLCDVTTMSGPPSLLSDEVHLDTRTSATVAQWLLSAAHSDATLIAIRPILTALAKICQQNRCLGAFLSVVARVCVTLSNRGQMTALNFFVSLVTKSSALLTAFVNELPSDPTSAEDVVDVVSHIFDTNSIVVEGGGKGVDVSCLRTFVSRLVAFLEPSSAVPQSDSSVHRPLRTSSLEEADDTMLDNPADDTTADVTEVAVTDDAGDAPADTSANVESPDTPGGDDVAAAGPAADAETRGENTAIDTAADKNDTADNTEYAVQNETDPAPPAIDDADMLLESFDGTAAPTVTQPACADLTHTVPAPVVAVKIVKETAGQKRKRLMKLSKISVKLTEARIQLEQLVEQEEFMEAATVQDKIAELVAQKKELAPPEEKALAAAAEAAAMAQVMASPAALDIIADVASATTTTPKPTSGAHDESNEAGTPTTTTTTTEEEDTPADRIVTSPTDPVEPADDNASVEDVVAEDPPPANPTNPDVGAVEPVIAPTAPQVSAATAEPSTLTERGDIASCPNDLALSAAKSLLSRFA